ncbi:hypothetical protein F8M41_003442 [Gigaspora margarita]|uniref:Uncharacterized protein n=1 Tax=Gigaspora margarita TaxID=4874 RepID=A0A8H4AY12_GIGMA|nr:hypothetical protein F8M41_003442 [Gigaspora margarita]
MPHWKIRNALRQIYRKTQDITSSRNHFAAQAGSEFSPVLLIVGMGIQIETGTSRRKNILTSTRQGEIRLNNQISLEKKSR